MEVVIMTTQINGLEVKKVEVAAETIYLKQAGFEAITSKNIDRMITRAKAVVESKKHNWSIIHDQMGLTYGLAKKDKFKKFADAMTLHGEKDPRCLQLLALADDIIAVGPQIHFVPGSAAERDIMPVMRKAMGLSVPSNSLEVPKVDEEAFEAVRNQLAEAFDVEE